MAAKPEAWVLVVSFLRFLELVEVNIFLISYRSGFHAQGVDWAGK